MTTPRTRQMSFTDYWNSFTADPMGFITANPMIAGISALVIWKMFPTVKRKLKNLMR